ncbi:hypothetical protein [Acinetobacter sp. Ac_5812]|uniref:STY1053 family phage-associated protein n=1 Tax=Acinetobacter sp. Ac_5812 TaxID=1848937 RepID=UPI0014900407|nr:hypothetical protein [Acinetobacter sp. Ac_5812]NNP67549.1 hypothetical protein [Acinetobacter sp. Ac_5812]
MSKQVQILLSRPLTVNLGTDEHGRAITVKLQAGLQSVEQEVAENWFVKAHCQELTQEDVENGELQKQVEQLQGDLKILQEQSDEATKTIEKLKGDVQEKDKEISDLKILLTKAEQTPADATAAGTKGAAKTKEQPKEA